MQACEPVCPIVNENDHLTLYNHGVKPLIKDEQSRTNLKEDPLQKPINDIDWILKDLPRSIDHHHASPALRSRSKGGVGIHILLPQI